MLADKSFARRAVLWNAMLQQVSREQKNRQHYRLPLEDVETILAMILRIRNAHAAGNEQAAGCLPMCFHDASRLRKVCEIFHHDQLSIRHYSWSALEHVITTYMYCRNCTQAAFADAVKRDFLTNSCSCSGAQGFSSSSALYSADSPVAASPCTADIMDDYADK
eukprot:15060-Heterococcus_DN1.PRE.2